MIPPKATLTARELTKTVYFSIPESTGILEAPYIFGACVDCQVIKKYNFDKFNYYRKIVTFLVRPNW
jgi:hypothetical protein